jgi:carboxypeptidase PM20D1
MKIHNPENDQYILINSFMIKFNKFKINLSSSISFYMMKKIGLFAAASVLVFIGILLFNAFRFEVPEATEASPISLITNDSAANHLSEALQIKTISFGDTLPIDTAEFIKFRTFMETRYPLVHSKLERKIFNQFSYVFIWKGVDTIQAPYVLMAHTDVVPVEAVAESKWSHPSFSGLILNDTIWGRGAVDDKASAIAILEATESLLKENYTPSRTIYLAFGHDEEIAGKRGANVFSAWFKEKNIKPALVLDEGGMIDSERFKNLDKAVAVIGTGEKGFVNIDLTVEISGGHSSQPEKETAIDVLNKAIVKVRANQMPAKITPTVRELIMNTYGRTGFVSRLALANEWLFKKSIINKMEENKQTNALVHTTLVPTIVKSGIKDNVIPSIAKATFNSRVLPGETSEDVVNFVRTAINDDRVKVQKQTISLMEPSPATSAEHPLFKKLAKITGGLDSNLLVSPYLLIGATDSRYFRSFSEAVFNFTPMKNPKGYHGIDERIGKQDLIRMITFYRELVKDDK